MIFQKLLDQIKEINDPVKNFRDRLVSAMWSEWTDPRSADEYRELNGWGDDHPLWCGQIVAVCARKAGIDPFYAKKIIPSTYRLASMDFGDSFYGDRPPFTKIEPDEIKPGHILCVWTSRDLPYGDHVVVCAHVEGDHFVCLEGNAIGLTKDGLWSPVRSVVLQVRHKNDVVAAYEVPTAAISV